MAERKRPTRVEVRQQVLDAALAVFARKGFDGASMDEVAEEAGFTKGALYSNFAGKDALFLALMDRQVERRLELIDELGQVDSLSTAEIGLRLTNAALNDKDWQLLFLDYWARAVRNPDIQESFRGHRRHLHRRIAQVADAALTGNGRSTDKAMSGDQIATLVLALSNGIAIEGMVDPEHLPLDLFGDVMAAVVGPA